MQFYYSCRHCQKDLGSIAGKMATWEQLGLQQLVELDDDVLQHDSSGNWHVRVICENCEEALRHNPSLHGIDYIIQ